jgi:hypothetical protein
LNVVINQPFKVAFWHLYNQWMTTVKHELTPNGRMKCAPLPTVCERILAAWCSVSPETVDKSLKVTGISIEIDRIDSFLLVCFLVNLTMLSSNLDHITSNEMVMGERRIGKDVEVSGHGIIQDTIPAFAWKD